MNYYEIEVLDVTQKNVSTKEYIIVKPILCHWSSQKFISTKYLYEMDKCNKNHADIYPF